MFTVDVEDYYHVSGFEKSIGREQWDGFESRVVRSTQCLLDLLAQHDVRGTFFILGWVAHRFRRLVKRIFAAGHEIGSHSYWHQLVYEQTPQQFQRDLRESRDVLEDIIGQPVTAYRAPSFSITRKSLWALPILAEEGFRCDSSIFPVHHDRYGIPSSPRELHRLETSAGALWEFPPAVLPVARWNLPVGGGGYFRLYPFFLTRCGLTAMQRTTGKPFTFYVHPWEVDPGQPYLGVGSRLSRFRHYVNLSSTESKLTRLLQRFRFARLCDVVAQAELQSGISREAMSGKQDQRSGTSVASNERE